MSHTGGEILATGVRHDDIDYLLVESRSKLCSLVEVEDVDEGRTAEEAKRVVYIDLLGLIESS